MALRAWLGVWSYHPAGQGIVFHGTAFHKGLQERRTGPTGGREVTAVISDHRQGNGLEAGPPGFSI